MGALLNAPLLLKTATHLQSPVLGSEGEELQPVSRKDPDFTAQILFLVRAKPRNPNSLSGRESPPRLSDCMNVESQTLHEPALILGHHLTARGKLISPGLSSQPRSTATWVLGVVRWKTRAWGQPEASRSQLWHLQKQQAEGSHMVPNPYSQFMIDSKLQVPCYSSSLRSRALFESS